MITRGINDSQERGISSSAEVKVWGNPCKKNNFNSERCFRRWQFSNPIHQPCTHFSMLVATWGMTLYLLATCSALTFSTRLDFSIFFRPISVPSDPTIQNRIKIRSNCVDIFTQTGFIKQPACSQAVCLFCTSILSLNNLLLPILSFLSRDEGIHSINSVDHGPKRNQSSDSIWCWRSSLWSSFCSVSFSYSIRFSLQLTSRVQSHSPLKLTTVHVLTLPR